MRTFKLPASRISKGSRHCVAMSFARLRAPRPPRVSHGFLCDIDPLVQLTLHSLAVIKWLKIKSEHNLFGSDIVAKGGWN